MIFILAYQECYFRYFRIAIYIDYLGDFGFVVYLFESADIFIGLLPAGDKVWQNIAIICDISCLIV